MLSYNCTSRDAARQTDWRKLSIFHSDDSDVIHCFASMFLCLFDVDHVLVTNDTWQVCSERYRRALCPYSILLFTRITVNEIWEMDFLALLYLIVSHGTLALALQKR